MHIHVYMQPACPLQSSQSSSFVSSSWIGSFKIPEKFSRATMKVLSEEVITDKARIEIVSASIPAHNISNTGRVHHDVQEVNQMLRTKLEMAL